MGRKTSQKSFNIMDHLPHNAPSWEPLVSFLAHFRPPFSLCLPSANPRYGYYELAADILAENAHLTYKFLPQDLYEFLDASIMVQTSPEEAYRK